MASGANLGAAPDFGKIGEEAECPPRDVTTPRVDASCRDSHVPFHVKRSGLHCNAQVQHARGTTDNAKPIMRSPGLRPGLRKLTCDCASPLGEARSGFHPRPQRRPQPIFLWKALLTPSLTGSQVS